MYNKSKDDNENISDDDKLSLFAVDIGDAFLTVPQVRPTYVTYVHPDGSKELFYLGFVLPGQRSGSSDWYDDFTKFLSTNLDIVECPAHPSLVKTADQTSRFAMQLHVDDMLGFAKRKFVHETFLPTLKKKYKVTAQLIENVGDFVTFLKRKHLLVSESELLLTPSPKHFDKLFALLRLDERASDAGDQSIVLESFRNLLFSSSRSQRVVALSSGEAELLPAASSLCDGIMIRELLGFLGYGRVKIFHHLDASAAKAILERSGVGKVRFDDQEFGQSENIHVDEREKQTFKQSMHVLRNIRVPIMIPKSALRAMVMSSMISIGSALSFGSGMDTFATVYALMFIEFPLMTLMILYLFTVAVIGTIMCMRSQPTVVIKSFDKPLRDEKMKDPIDVASRSSSKSSSGSVTGEEVMIKQRRKRSTTKIEHPVWIASEFGKKYHMIGCGKLNQSLEVAQSLLCYGVRKSVLINTDAAKSNYAAAAGLLKRSGRDASKMQAVPGGTDFMANVWHFGYAPKLAGCWLAPNAAAMCRVLVMGQVSIIAFELSNVVDVLGEVSCDSMSEALLSLDQSSPNWSRLKGRMIEMRAGDVLWGEAGLHDDVMQLALAIALIRIVIVMKKA
ncbi:ABHD17A [Symbiodinium necroappetens]|uniref:ABHD17A protein n=1 Tax=Symbiodinium necroappetens TaxID=1628268 RepID=A0A812WJU3_9DINO|nr:ABHD17A [Symbiodinium necroappetens]